VPTGKFMSTEITTIDVGLRALAEATTPVDFVRLPNAADAMQVYAR
jgi:hypothetical protein